MSRATKSVLALISGLALALGLISGATAKPVAVRHASTHASHSVHHASKSAAKKAAAKKAAAKRAAAKKAAAKKAAAKKAAKLASQAQKRAARKTLMGDILNAITPSAPLDLPTVDPSPSDPSTGVPSGEMPVMKIACMVVYQNGKSPCNWYGRVDSKPTAQQFAFDEALRAAYQTQATANQDAYNAFEAATVDARNLLNQAWSGDKAENQWMQMYLDYLVATSDAQVALNAATTAANTAFVDAKYAAMADFDAATYDASTEKGAAALAALADYRAASKALDLQQFSQNLDDSSKLTDGMITRMQAFIALLGTLNSDADISAARDAYYADLGTFYSDTFTASQEGMQSFYDAVNNAEAAFTALTGEAPSHPEYSAWWWYGEGDPKVVIDPLPPVPVDCPVPVAYADSSDSNDPAVQPTPVDCSMNPVDPIVDCGDPAVKQVRSECQSVIVDPVPGDKGDGVEPVWGDASGSGDNPDSDSNADSDSGDAKPPISICPVCPPAPEYTKPALAPSFR